MSTTKKMTRNASGQTKRQFFNSLYHAIFCQLLAERGLTQADVKAGKLATAEHNAVCDLAYADAKRRTESEWK